MKVFLLLALICLSTEGRAQGTIKSIRDFGVLPDNDAAINTKNLQKAIDWATEYGAALFVTPSDKPYPVNSGIILKNNVSLIGVHGPTPRGTRHPSAKTPVGSVFNILDDKHAFITVESGTQLKGIQFWYSQQELDDPAGIIKYPPVIKVSGSSSTQGVTLSNLTFYGEYITMDFNAKSDVPCELILIEHCYGYPLSGEFIRIDYCYDIPRILHCHVNPAIMRKIGLHLSKAVIDHVVNNKTFAYTINHTDNAQLMDVFTFGTWGGILLGEESYGQLTNFNLDCVAVGIHKKGSQSKNRNWMIAQGSIIANAGETAEETHPFIIEGEGHTAISNVEAFSGDNPALTNIGKSSDYMLVKGDKKLTVSMVGCRMRNYTSDEPLTIKNPHAVLQAVACFDKEENLYNITISK
ncbi:hypothetical protein EDD80_11574 [Anseongella ginsenosidimutans]|uniref:Pectate lyase-like protein n=1 Tax=Anseongella ginsenosidimutans TaxID=496056 RepID=A0A4R3KLS0_9SPHI|nr:hypothetical protein [Anseongella ginsenosidimutans]QEC51889.1 hypothetical protein FRZ59_05760 [Anseongella ginsenosidimutans]TCS85091.1 hypothetical protein EDD80_11574 [Anseongella ginsenosidimutans]